MTNLEYRRALARLKLSIAGVDTTRELGLQRRQLYRIAAGDAPVPEPVAKLLQAKLAAANHARARD